MTIRATLTTATATLAVAALGAAAENPAPASAQDYAPYEMECESGDYAYQRCDAPSGFFIGEARLAEQLSTNECLEGSSWGYDRDGVWVDDGCRGRFALIGAAGGDELLRVDCASSNYGRVECPAGVGIRSVRLERQRSQSRCFEGATWGWSARTIWVDRGCRGDFVVNDPADLPAPPRSELSEGDDGWEGSSDGRGPRASRNEILQACQRAMIEEAWENGLWSVQLRPGYQTEFERGVLLRGRAVTFGPDGFHPVDATCLFRRGEVREVTLRFSEFE